MVGRRGWRFIVAGLFVGGVGAGCGNSAPGRSVVEPPERPQEVDTGVPDPGGVTGDDTPKPDPVDPGNPPEQQHDAGVPPEQDAGTPPEQPDPAACEGVPSISPQQLAAFELWSHRGDREISCFATAPDGAGGALVLRGNGVTFQIATRSGGSLFWYSVNDFSATAQPGGMLGITDPIQDVPQWLLFVDGPTGYARQQPNEAAEIVMTSVDPTGGLRAVLADGTLKAYSVHGETRWSLPVSLSVPLSAVGVDARGHTLVLAVGDTRFGPSTVEGLWVDSDGQPGQPFLALAQAPAGSYELMPQVNEGLFLAVNHGARTWAAAFQSLQPEASPAPEWLARGAERPLQLLPGGKGYFRPSATDTGNWSCERQAELLSPTGASCGTLPFLSSPKGDWSPCKHLMLGADGTVVEPVGWIEPEWADREGHPVYCSVRYWPRLLQ
ncbi:hook length control protein FliK [Corallococcus coralloides DSM 2259]|uniref:Hook length control protein FliK n=1 Tax=Corallococcus coralloides (strain ATCC 25202 / DSM 2259 / NBRC 100086 / M2) TaxID=1144275 RepID=H8MHN1_CORCM|nr:hypothetical protein [Corallococcus coralloides]AFE04439.1 hook length control protein FliK [Corallococcus coralloides DSM 2259]